MKNNKDIAFVVEAGLCTGCGTCVSICPQDAIKMEEAPVGLLVANIDLEACNSCGLCLRVCPGFHLEPGLLDNKFDPFKGPVLAAFCGYARDSEIQTGGQSGGIVTALLSHLIETGYVSEVLVTHIPGDGSLRPASYFATTQQELFRAMGSKYCPVAVNASFREVSKKKEPIAIVGMPCHVHGIRNLQKVIPKRSGDIKLIIGLFCDRILTFGAVDYLITKTGVGKREVADFRYRNKEWRGYPGDVYVKTKDGRILNLNRKFRMDCKDTFTPARCRICFDKMNIFSDIAVGDAWGVRESKEGFNSVIARTLRGLDALHSAEDAGVIILDEVSANEIFKGQAVEIKRKQWYAYTKVWDDKGSLTPDFGIPTKRWENSEKCGKLRYYRKQLNWADQLSRKSTSEEALRAAKRHLLGSKCRFWLSQIRLIRMVLKVLSFTKYFVFKRYDS